MKITGKITVIALLWLIFVNPGTLTHIDTFRRLNMSHSWWTGTEEQFVGNKIVIKVNNKNYIPYDLGQSMLMLPGDYLGTHLGKNLNREKEQKAIREAVVSFFIFLPINLAAVIVCFRFLKLFNYSEKIAALSSIVWLIGTTVLFYSSVHQQNNQILLLVLISYQMALAYALKAKKHLVIFSGVALGIAFFIRITSVLYVASALVFLVGCVVSRTKNNPVAVGFQSAMLWMAGFIPFVLLERWLSYIRYGSWSATTVSLHLQVYAKASSLIDSNAIAQSEDRGLAFLGLLTNTKLEALLAPLISPEKSIFIYDPLVLPCLILLFVCWKFLARDTKWYSIAAIVAFLLHLYIYSWTIGWIKAPIWGARYHITSIHLLLVPLIPLLVRGAATQIDKTKQQLSKILTWAARIIIVLAILIQFSSIAFDSNLELFQQELGIGSSFKLGQRFKNISAFMNNSTKSNFDFTQVEDDPIKAAALKEQIEMKDGWNILPYIYQSELEADSAFNKLISPLIWLWILIFIAASASTLWIFVR